MLRNLHLRIGSEDIGGKWDEVMLLFFGGVREVDIVLKYKESTVFRERTSGA